MIDSELAGIWMGSLEVSGTELRIVFNISSKTDKSLTVSMDSPDQGVKGIPVDKVTLETDKISMQVESIKGLYEGIIKDNLTIYGQWTQGGESVQMALCRVDKVPELLRPQEPEKPYPYNEDEVVYDNCNAGIKLAGTLTRPRSGGQFPAVILITGSGQHDRDESVSGHRPFLVLADNLTRRGIAVLRVDDRGIGGSTGNFSLATSEDFADDVLAGVEYLKSRKDIDHNQIGLIGHSEGGLIAPMAATRSQDVAFIVMMAGPGLIGEELLLLQHDRILKAEGVSNDTISKNRVLMERIFSIVKMEKDDFSAQDDLNLKQYLSPWYRFFLTYDPVPTLTKVRVPVLAIIGEKDLQVPPKENLKGIEEALIAGGNEHYTVKELPGLNHLFQTARTGSPAEYGTIEETISSVALDVIGEWIMQQTGK
ncbi:MAG: alpha/beta fold hydrolase [Candidatus Methanoperedens sp.]|nr:alpha/beta fold hydrolase [Candidatus Methanoperedens sp.]